MKLEGSLDAFGLPDVFQLLHATRKTGCLEVRRHAPSGHGAVYFVEGEVVTAMLDPGPLALMRRLVMLGVADETDLVRAGEHVAEHGGGMVDALVTLDPDRTGRVTAIAHEQSVEAVFEVVRWTDGEFAFAPDARAFDELGLCLSAADLVAEAEARKTRWDEASVIVSGPDAVPAVVVDVPDDPGLSRDEWAVLSLVDGRRSVREVVELTGRGPFLAVTVMADLVSRGLLTMRPDEGTAHERGRRLQLLMTLAQAERAATGGADPATHERLPGTVNGSEPEVAPLVDDPRDLEVATASMVHDDAPDTGPVLLGGAHTPHNVVPPRPEPFLPRRAPEHPEPSEAGGSVLTPAASTGVPPVTTTVVGSNAVVTDSVVSRDPSINRSMVLRLIAGVRGL